ncbi:DUF4249 domain-containing protein [Belliella sp. R4-6]|uniref:DUF4249 domain-containing protein n=1 Tax=Belliella alkalica TaxID=1730871 RepID=A0ABS9VCJ6_9BACT|nr:DUF4249 family protein [Belliella alkalica]MCH7414154.1 DUF4249 domain-containing protein [Belliella alkalica]
MIKKLTIFLLLIAGIFTNSCIDEVVIEVPGFEPQLVVDGWYGNSIEDTYIRIYYSAEYQSGVVTPQYRQANVNLLYIQDQNGRRINFIPVPNSISFLPENYFDPEPGLSYQLVFQLTNGNSYRSDFEMMPPKVEIEEITESAFEALEVINTPGVSLSQIRTFASINAQISDPGVGEFGYMFSTSGISEDFTFSESDNCSCTCYSFISNIFDKLNLLSNREFQSRSFQHSLGDIPLTSLGRFYVNTRVRTVSKNNLEYLLKIDEQQKNTGSIFDVSPFRIKGNVRNVAENQNSVVLGNFFVFQQSGLEKLVFRTEIRAASLDLNHVFDLPPLVNSSCIEIYPDATPIPPIPFR